MDWIEPDWPSPLPVRAFCTTRSGGVSVGAFASLNLADHVGDEPLCVANNRTLIRECLGLPAEPRWLQQIHGCSVADATATTANCRADAAIARRPGTVCAVLHQRLAGDDGGRFLGFGPGNRHHGRRHHGARRRSGRQVRRPDGH